MLTERDGLFAESSDDVLGSEQGRPESSYPCVSIRVRFADFAFAHG